MGTETPNKGGRPTLPAEQKRKRRLLYATDDEWSTYQDAAAQAGHNTVAQWIRAVLDTATG